MQETPLTPRPRVAVQNLADEVYELIAKEFIFSGQVPVGELLPSETKLATHYGVSRVTIRTALRMLKDAHLISIRNGVGSVVLQWPTFASEGLDQLLSLETYASDTSQKVDTTDLEWREDHATEALAQKLGLPPGAPVYVATRVKLFNGVRVAAGTECVPASVLPLHVLQDEFAGSVMDVLLAHPELGIEYADAELMPAKLPAEIARRLGVRTGTVAQYLEQVMFNHDGTAVQWGEAWLLADHYRLRVRRRVARTQPGRPGA